MNTLRFTLSLHASPFTLPPSHTRFHDSAEILERDGDEHSVGSEGEGGEGEGGEGRGGSGGDEGEDGEEHLVVLVGDEYGEPRDNPDEQGRRHGGWHGGWDGS